MNPPNNLDLQGNFENHPPAELLCEIGQARLDGSLRLSNGEQKVIVYFRGGEIIFAVSNARSARLFEILLKQNRILKQTLSEFPDFGNDHALADFLVKRKVILREEINTVFKAQIAGILQSVVSWNSGEWFFSPLVRLRENINFITNYRKILLEHARQVSPAFVGKRLAHFDEAFFPTADENNLSMLPKEAFILSRLDGSPLKLSEIMQLGVLPEAEILQTIYALWLGGFLTRSGWDAAFSMKKIEVIRAAKVSRVKEAFSHAPVAPLVREKFVETKTPKTETEQIREITVEEYLERVEKAQTNYEILGIDAKALQTEIKPAYFLLARRFHPDIFHKETDANLAQRIQNAFTELARAYENLKTKEARETYDFKVRKELAEMEKKQARREAAAETNEPVVNVEIEDHAAENFEKGFSSLMEENFEEAVPFLARAVHLAPQNARYHAYYGKALSAFEKYRHKAEGELQTAVKIDANNPTFRLLLAEFFVQYNLFKRAEGELSRLLTVFPDNKEAKRLLDSLVNK